MPEDRAVSIAPLNVAPSSLARAIGDTVEWSTVAAVAATAAYLTFSLVYLLDYPPVYSDEPWLLSAPIHIIKTGHDGLPMFGEHYSAALYYDYYVAGFLKVFGIGIGVGRLISVLHGLGLMVLVYLIARAIASRTAWIAPAVLIATFPFVEASHYIRPDIITTFYAVLAVWLYLLGREGRQPVLLAAAGASAGFATGLFFQSIWVVALLSSWAAADLQRLRARIGWLLGGFVAALIPLGVFILGDLRDYRRFTTKFGGSSIFGPSHQKGTLIAAVWHSLEREPNRYLAVERWSHSRLYVVALAALAAVSLAGVCARHRFRTATFLLIPLATIALAGVNKTSLYLLVGAPALGVLAATLAARNRLTLAVTLALTILLTAGYGYNIGHAVSPVRTDYQSIARAYRSAYVYPPRSIVIGLPIVYAYYLRDQSIEFRSVHYFTSFRNFHLEPAREIAARLDAASRTRKVYLVYDAPGFYTTMRQFDFGHSRLGALRKLVNTRFKPVAAVRVRGSAYGDFDTTIARYVSRSSKSHG